MISEPAAAGRVERRPALTPTDLALLGVVAVWGFGYVAFKVGQSEIPTGLFNLLRYVVVVPMLWAVLLRSGEQWRLPRRDWPRALATGLIGVLVYSMLFASAAKMTTAGAVVALAGVAMVRRS